MSCEKDDPTVIDPTLHFPSILSADVTPNAFDTIYLNGVIHATVISEIAINSVTARVLNPTNFPLASISLKDDGIGPDSIAGDGIYTARMNFTLVCKLVGNYKVEITAENTEGNPSNIINAPFSVFSVFNNPPSLTNVIMPDSVRRPSGLNGDSIIVFEIFAMPTDPDGICDVGDVLFHSFKPNGAPGNNGNPILLYDDGEQGQHCDSIAGDGRFSVCVKILNNPLNPNNQVPDLGSYTFKFIAEDRGTPHLVSDTLIEHIFVHQ